MYGLQYSFYDRPNCPSQMKTWFKQCICYQLTKAVQDNTFLEKGKGNAVVLLQFKPPSFGNESM